MTLKIWLHTALLVTAVIFFTSLSARCEQVFAYCKASVGASDTFYFSRVYEFNVPSGDIAVRLEHDSYSFDQYGSAHWDVKGALSGYCAQAKSRAAATDALNAEAAWFKQTKIKFVFTDWAPSD